MTKTKMAYQMRQHHQGPKTHYTKTVSRIRRKFKRGFIYGTAAGAAFAGVVGALAADEYTIPACVAILLSAAWLAFLHEVNT